LTETPVLLVIDSQVGFREQSYWGVSANPECHTNIEKLVLHWREKSWPIVFVKHNSKNPASPLNPSSPGNELEGFLAGARDLDIQKSVNSAFYGTPDLDLWLTERNLRNLVICGITTNFCCETTARMAGNLGYAVKFVLDATTAFPVKDRGGGVISGTEVMRMTAANLHPEFAQVVSTADLVR
jgi:nicotinamidase-related amidase